MQEDDFDALTTSPFLFHTTPTFFVTESNFKTLFIFSSSVQKCHNQLTTVNCCSSLLKLSLIFDRNIDTSHSKGSLYQYLSLSMTSHCCPEYTLQIEICPCKFLANVWASFLGWGWNFMSKLSTYILPRRITLCCSRSDEQRSIL